MPHILDAIDKVDGVFDVVAVIGPFFSNVEKVRQAAATNKHCVRLAYQPESLRSLMMEADLAISTGGQTLIELVSVGCPTIALCVIDNQKNNVRGLSSLGMVEACWPDNGKDFISALQNTLDKLVQGEELRGDMGKRGQGLIDGKGTMRVAREMASYFAVV